MCKNPLESCLHPRAMAAKGARLQTVLRWNGRNYTRIKPHKTKFQIKRIEGTQRWRWREGWAPAVSSRGWSLPCERARLSGEAKNNMYHQPSWGSKNPIRREVGGSPLRGMWLLGDQVQLMGGNLLRLLRFWPQNATASPDRLWRKDQIKAFAGVGAL